VPRSGIGLNELLGCKMGTGNQVDC
jgi:hypothetical protein